MKNNEKSVVNLYMEIDELIAIMDAKSRNIKMRISTNTVKEIVIALKLLKSNGIESVSPLDILQEEPKCEVVGNEKIQVF